MDREVFGTRHTPFRHWPYKVQLEESGIRSSGSSDDSQTKFGINAGAGFDIKAGSAGLFVEGRFHDVFTSVNNTTFIPLTIGVRFGGS